MVNNRRRCTAFILRFVGRVLLPILRFLLTLVHGKPRRSLPPDSGKPLAVALAQRRGESHQRQHGSRHHAPPSARGGVPGNAVDRGRDNEHRSGRRLCRGHRPSRPEPYRRQPERPLAARGKPKPTGAIGRSSSPTHRNRPNFPAIAARHWNMATGRWSCCRWSIAIPTAAALSCPCARETV